MARVIYIRVTPDEHAAIVDAAHAARTNLQQFCLLALQDAVERWQPLGLPPAAHAACEDLSSPGQHSAPLVAAGPWGP